MAPTLEILFGFDEPDVQMGICRYLEDCGYAVHAAVKLNKIGIEDYLNLNPSCRTVVLKEVFSQKQKYTAEELARLTDAHDVNVVVVLSEKHHGTEYMNRLYIAGITSAIFQKGRRGGASVKEIAGLIMQKRSRQDARVYYGIDDEKIDLGYLSDHAFAEYFHSLNDPDYGSTLLERFLQVCSYMTPQKLADFIKRLPDDAKNELSLYAEFYEIVDALKQYFNIDLGIKRPKKVKVGLKTPDILLETKERIANGETGMKDQYNTVEPSFEGNDNIQTYRPDMDDAGSESDIQEFDMSDLFGVTDLDDDLDIGSLFEGGLSDDTDPYVEKATTVEKKSVVKEEKTEYVPPEPDEEDEEEDESTAPKARKRLLRKSEKKDKAKGKEDSRRKELKKGRAERKAEKKAQKEDADIDADLEEGESKKVNIGFIIGSIAIWAGICGFLIFDFLYLM